MGVTLRLSAMALALVLASALCAGSAASAASAALSPGSWVTRAPMQVARFSLGAAAVNGRIYAIGGNTRSGGGGTLKGPLPVKGGITGVNEEYDPETDTWRFKTPMPTARMDFAIAAYKGKIYCIGGYAADGNATGVNEAYDPETDTWETKAPMPTPRWSLQANVANGKIYLIGGYIPDDSGFGGSITNLNEVYDPETDTWTTAAPILTGTADYPSAAIDGKIYIIGGLSSSPQSDLNQIYDPKTNTWREGTRMPNGLRYGAAAATTGANAIKRIYFFSNSATQIYDPARDKWVIGATIPTSRFSFAAAVLNDLIYVLGGYTTSYPDGWYSWPYGPTITPHATNEVYVPFAYGTRDPTYVPPDTEPPKIAVHSPANKTYHTTSIPLNFTINEHVKTITYVLDGGPETPLAGNITLERLAAGVHSITLYAVDLEGNRGASETIYFTIAEASKPSLALIATATGTAATATAATYMLRRRIKRRHQTRI
ncbi:MAG: kelch repeat-containing protein [Candidatus Bathyarchaeia archaeon]